MKKSINQSTITFILNGISIISLIFMVFSLSSYNKINNQLNMAQTERFELTYNANRFMNGSAYLTNEVRAFASTGLQKHYDNYWNEVDNLKNRDIGIKKMQEIGITKEEQDLIDDMSSISNELIPLEENAMKQAMAGQKQQAINYVYGTAYN
ncbi:MAG: methyl-accepting chemotaxis protein, partial [Lachnospiraceae bacterium]|nr:methyl-accepting chemotaxis protein [Lachnospiraceae bacterium]